MAQASEQRSVAVAEATQTEPGDGVLSWSGLGVAAPDLALSIVFLTVWLDPSRMPAKTITHFTLLMVLEFIIVHSSAFTGSVVVSDATRAKKTLTLLGLGMFYTLFVGGFSLAFKSWWPLGSFWMLMLNRMAGVLFGQAPEGREKQYVVGSWAASVLFYIGGVFLTIFLPVPRFGITAAVVAAEQMPGTGLWVSQPHRVIAFGFLYFLAQGLWELFVAWRLGQGRDPIPGRG